MIHVVVPSAGLATRPIGAAGLGRDFRIGQVQVQDLNGVVVQGEQLGVGVVIRHDVLLRHLFVEPTRNVAVLVGVDEQAAAVDFERLLDGGEFVAQLGSGLVDEHLLAKPTVEDPLGKGRTVFQIEVVGNLLGQAIPRQNFAVRLRHHVVAKPRTRGLHTVTTAPQQAEEQHGCDRAGWNHSRTRLYSASRLILWRYFRWSSKIHSFSRWSW